MKVIESTQNEIVKRYAKLLQKKHRDIENLFIIEGKKNVYDSLGHLQPNEIESILLCHESVDEFLGIFGSLNEKIIATDQRVLQKISGLASQTEIIVVARQREYSKNITNKLCVYLDRIRDPGNLGTIIRTAAASGFGVILDNCCDLYNQKVIRSSMSAISTVDILIANKNTLNEYKSIGYKIVGADASGKNIFNFPNHSISSPLIIAIGNEAEGLDDNVLSHCGDLVAIPIDGIESLNAALAAGILMFEYKYRLIKPNI